MKSKRPFFTLFLLAAVLLAACGSAASTAPSGAASKPSAVSATAAKPSGLTKVVASYSNILADDIPIWVTKEAGLFEKHGLDTDVRLIESATGVAALIAGETQFGQFGGSEALSAASAGGDLVMLATFSPTYPFVMQVQPSIKSVADFKGKKVGVSRFGSSSDIATRVGLRKVGLDPDKDVDVIQVGSATARVAALRSGAINGGLAEPPENIALEKEGFRALFDMATMGLPAVGFCLVATRSYVNGHKDAVQNYVDAVIEGIAREKADKAFSIQVMKKYFKSDDEEALGATWDYFANKVTAAQPMPNAEGFADAKAELGKKEPKIANFDADKFIDASYVKSAIDRGLAAKG